MTSDQYESERMSLNCITVVQKTQDSVYELLLLLLVVVVVVVLVVLLV